MNNPQTSNKGAERKQPPALKPGHEEFKAGQGYGSGETDADAGKNLSDAQYGDNPLPPSGGNWGEKGKKAE